MPPRKALALKPAPALTFHPVSVTRAVLPTGCVKPPPTLKVKWGTSCALAATPKITPTESTAKLLITPPYPLDPRVNGRVTRLGTLILIDVAVTQAPQCASSRLPGGHPPRRAPNGSGRPEARTFPRIAGRAA